MNYEEMVCQMLEHADNTRTPEGWTNLMRCLSFGIAQCSANAVNLEVQEELLNNTFAAIREEAKAIFLETNSLSNEDLLKHSVTVGPMQ